MILHLAGRDFAVKNFKTFNIIEIEYTFSDDFCTSLSFILVNMSSFVITADLTNMWGKKKTAWGENEHVLGKEVNKLWGETRTEHVHLSPHAIKLGRKGSLKVNEK
ncbi:Importin-11 [Armadillidium vulgare]|nr:Importin-11 [Armadillidium vulgare]